MFVKRAESISRLRAKRSIALTLASIVRASSELTLVRSPITLTAGTLAPALLSTFCKPERIGPVVSLEPVNVLVKFCILRPAPNANARKSRDGAARTNIVASSIAERIPRRGNRVKIDHASTIFFENAPCVAPPTALIRFFLDLISQSIEPISSYGSEPTAQVD